MNYKLTANQGWQCPVCGKVNAPWVVECDCHRRASAITNGTSTGDVDWMHHESQTISNNEHIVGAIACAKREEYKKQDAEIKVGDEVEFGDDGHERGFIVTCICSDARPAGYRGFTTFDRYGVKKFGEPAYHDADFVRKTGRHVDLSEFFRG